MHLLYILTVYKLDDVFLYFILTGGQCSSYESLDTTTRNCQQLVIDSAVAVRWYKLECYNNYFSSCRSSWCHHFTSCLGQTWKWEHLCKWAFRWYYYFKITATAGGVNSSPVRLHVKLCYQNWWNYRERIYIIGVTKYKSGSGNAKNGLYEFHFCRRNSHPDSIKSIWHEIFGVCRGVVRWKFQLALVTI